MLSFSNHTSPLAKMLTLPSSKGCTLSLGCRWTAGFWPEALALLCCFIRLYKWCLIPQCRWQSWLHYTTYTTWLCLSENWDLDFVSKLFFLRAETEGITILFHLLLFFSQTFLLLRFNLRRSKSRQKSQVLLWWNLVFNPVLSYEGLKTTQLPSFNLFGIKEPSRTWSLLGIDSKCRNFFWQVVNYFQVSFVVVLAVL